MRYQWYWPNWWKLWPSYSKIADLSTNEGYNNYELNLNAFCFGPFQMKWYTVT